MNHTFDLSRSETAGHAPLPGLAKLFLIQAYFLLPALLILQAFFFFASGEVYRGEGLVEITLWHLSCFGLCAWNLIVIVGLHTRAAWALDSATRFSAGMIVFFAAAAIRLLTFMSDMHFSLDYYSFGGFYELYLAMAPGMAAVACLQFYAWARYFQFSGKIRAAFGQEAPKVDTQGKPGRPLGVALLHLFCGSLLLFSLVFYLSIWLGARGMDGGLMGLILIMGLPKMVFPLLLFALTSGAGRNFRPLHFCFGAWIVINSLWGTAFPLLGYSGLFQADIGIFYQLNAIVGNFPVSAQVLPVILAALWWRLSYSSEDATWFANRQDSGRAASSSKQLMLVLSGYIVYFLFTYSGYWLHSLITNLGTPEICLSVFMVALLVLAGFGICWNIKGDPRARHSFLALACGGLAMLAAMLALTVWQNIQSEYSSLRFVFSYSLPYMAMEMAIVAGGLYFLLRQRTGQLLQITVLKLLCLAVAAMFIVPRLAQFCLMLATNDGLELGQAFLLLLGGIARQESYFSDSAELVFSPSNLLAFCILPLLLLAWLKTGRARRLSRPSLLAWLGVWLMLVQSTAAMQYATTVLSGGRGDPFMGGFDAKPNMISVALLMFIFYFCSSRRFALWASGDNEEAAPVPAAKPVLEKA